jgi:hypothetical protein
METSTIVNGKGVNVQKIIWNSEKLEDKKVR